MCVTPRFPALLPSPPPSNSGRSARGEPGTPSSASCAAARAPTPSSAIAILRPTRLGLLSRVWPNWRSALCIVKPETVIAWHRQGSRLYWKWKSRVRHGRPSVPTEVQNLIQKMSSANPRWGAPRLHGELLKLGIHLAQATVAKYMVCHRKPPSQTWRTFLENHAKELVSTDFFVVPTATFRLLFVFLVVARHNSKCTSKIVMKRVSRHEMG